MDACPQCNANIEFHRLGINRGDFVSNSRLSECPACGFDLSKTPTLQPTSLPEHILNDYQNLLIMISSNSWDQSLKLPAFYPLSFFDGFKAILRLLNKASATALREALNARFPINLAVERPGAIEFGYLDITERFKLVATSLWLLHGWPGRLGGLLSEARQSRSRFAEEPNRLPFWLLQAVNEYVDQRIYIPSQEEVVSVRNYLTSKGEVVTKRAMAKLLGVGVGYIK